MNHVSRFLRFLCVLDGRGRTALQRIHGYSRSTITRHLRLARKLGVVVQYDGLKDRFSVTDSGPFDLSKLAQAAHASSRQYRGGQIEARH